MIIRYSANALVGQLLLPSNYVGMRTPEDLAELAAVAHWKDHPQETPTFITVIHLQDVDGHDLGLFEVRCERRPVFIASKLRQA
ncbi:hypothetical protein [Pseudomonas mediterranea]|jgi:hypothetical protein|uniref:Uncharacterized protein n=1 Tax=Pseudomonas mediterranea TaxID=183795 RepID=A0AAX2D5W9_9PSED|nr:hypothetical protein [Pseudomonas mediterranea]KGU82391.1 hypothetical protein N005_27435 [Pseudomonas mediterranea CFBP 5447]MDU9027939.1 hypothetical protein [Pseudomonas mediterranea]UZE01119.1 hypothetical protein LOY71_00380 [Pseudomonas mediterranea]CAH0321443.1 hypothetical protein SRABI112_05336 [Pseudomonas mediterranea]SDU10937.1 hypothetical protein SAMN05216476_0470 [Pseudomonas mediterranea]